MSMVRRGILAKENTATRWYLDLEEPMMMIGGTHCVLDNFRKQKGDSDSEKKKSVEASVHLAFCVRFYRDQMEAGRYFVHEDLDARNVSEAKLVRDLSQEAGCS